MPCAPLSFTVPSHGRARRWADEGPRCPRWLPDDRLTRVSGGVEPSRLARCLREERAHQRAKVSSATLWACGLAPFMLADRERESHLALALVAIVLVTGHGSTSLSHRTGGRGGLATDFYTRENTPPAAVVKVYSAARLALPNDERVHVRP